MLKHFRRTQGSDLFSTRRIENLTDGVFAIAMTILVLDLKIPYGTAIGNHGQLMAYLGQNAALFRNFIISFLLLATMWSIHMRQFEHVDRVDRHATMVNSLRLLLVVSIPFTASVAGNYPSLVTARELLALNFFFLSLASLWQWFYICRHPEFSHDMTDAGRSQGLRRNLAFTLVAAVVCGLVVPFGEFAYLAYFAIPLVMPILQYRPQRQR